MNTKFLGIPWFVWGLLALVVAVIFTVIWPSGKVSGANNTGSLQYVILRWFHGLVWLLLAVSFFVRSGNNSASSGTANILALAALGVYIVFMVMVVSR